MPQSYIFSAKLFALRRQTNASRLLLLTQNSPIIANIRKTYSNNHNTGSEYLLLSSFNDNFAPSRCKKHLKIDEMKILSCSIFAMLAFVAAPSASAQVSRIALETRHCQHENYVNVYEYDFVDVQPQFPGDDRGLMNYINHERKYPCDAYRSHIQGRVVCSFIVNTDGSVCNVSVIKGVHPSLDREAMRIVKNMPAWKPGRLGGEDVPVRCIIPIAFRL